MKLADVVLGVSLFNGLRELRRGFQTQTTPVPVPRTGPVQPGLAPPNARPDGTPRYEMPKLDAAATAAATVRLAPNPGRPWGRAFVPRVCAGAPRLLALRSVVRAPGLLGNLPVESWRVVPLGQGEQNAAELLEARLSAGMSALASLSLVILPLGGDPACYLVFADPSEARHGSSSGGSDFALLAEPGGMLDVVVPMPGDEVAAAPAAAPVKAPPPKPRAPKRAAVVEAADLAGAAPHLNGASKASHAADATADTDPAPSAPAAGEA